MNISELKDDIEEIYFIVKQMTVKTIIHLLTPIKYLPTSKEGVAIIYYVERWNNVKEVFTDIQYSIDKPCGQYVSTYSYLNNVTIEKKNKICQEVKLCEFSNPELLEMNHDSANDNNVNAIPTNIITS
ncbi:7400_t:CDS:2 [Rhizophagus irregularis]|nr:7400_t:CDS:2 [Rhizophagus irregularis]